MRTKDENCHGGFERAHSKPKRDRGGGGRLEKKKEEKREKRASLSKAVASGKCWRIS